MRLTALCVSFSSCGSPYGGACEDLLRVTCDICPQQSDYDEIACTCLENGVLTKDDAPEGWYATDEDAAMECSSLLYSLTYSSPDEAAYCKREEAMFAEYDKDYCLDTEGYGYGTFYSY